MNKTWFKATPDSGTLKAGASIVVTVKLRNSANSLAKGTHRGQVKFKNKTNGIGNTKRKVKLKVK